ncbi:MAG TPA: MBL fold metallo-hydrolase [Bryobacteraceae bacterium]|nr:MBL fold metallo-hydrolase [Bryobacteraceae bacterium]
MNNPWKLVLGLSALLAVASVAPRATAQQPIKGVNQKDVKSLQALIDAYRRQDPLKVTKLGDNLYLAKGGRGGNDANVGFAVGRTGVIFVDSKNSPESEKDVLDEIVKITSQPVKTAIILHSDHEKGVTALPAGLTIVAQENTRKEMEVSTARDAVPREYFPTKTVAKDETMTIDGIRVRLLHWAPAHTSGDLAAYFPAQKVVFSGDLLVTDFPLSGTQIHPELHGSVAGWIESVKQMLTLDADTFVSGHGDLFTRNDVRTKLAFMQDKWDRMKALVARGKSLEEIETALGESAPSQRNPASVIPPPSVTTEVIYHEMTAKE